MTKRIIATAALLGCLASTSRADAIPGGHGALTIALTVIQEDDSKFSESKSYEAHQAAIEADQNSTRTLTYGIKKSKIGNRQILEALVEEELIPEIKGWSLIYVLSEAYTGPVAYKKNTAPVAVPPKFFDLGSSYGGYETGKFVSKYTAKKNTLNESSSGTYATFASDMVIATIGLSGIQTTSFSYSESATLPETEEGDPVAGPFSFSHKLGGTLQGSVGYGIVTGTFSTPTIKSKADASAYIPEGDYDDIK